MSISECPPNITFVAGDLDSFMIHGVTYELGDMRDLLAGLLHCPASCLVDSLAVAGLIELLRTKGLWVASVRYGYVFGALLGGSVAHHRFPPSTHFQHCTPHSFSGDSKFHVPAVAAHPTLDPQLRDRARAADNLAALNKAGKLWSNASLERAAAVFEREWTTLVREERPGRVAMGQAGGAVRRITGGKGEEDAISALGEKMIVRMSKLDLGFSEMLPPEGDIGSHAVAWQRFVASAVKAFTSLDLLHATRQLLQYAKGSFGLVTSHSLECEEAVVIAARGQTMSIACYPQQGLVLWGSEVSATKVAMGTTNNSSLPSDGNDEGAPKPGPLSFKRNSILGSRPGSRPSILGGLGGTKSGPPKIGVAAPNAVDISITPRSVDDLATAKDTARRLSDSRRHDLTMDDFHLLQKNNSFRLDLDDVPALEP